jgi:ribonuclease HI
MCCYGVVVLSIRDEKAKMYRKMFGNLGKQDTHQVAGEIEGVIRAMALAYMLKVQTLLVVHDYSGIGNWAKRKWKTNVEDSKRLVRSYDFVRKSGINIDFRWCKSHSGNKMNDLADRLAERAASTSIRKKLPPLDLLFSSQEVPLLGEPEEMEIIADEF